MALDSGVCARETKHVMHRDRKRLGIIGGLGALGGADILFKLVQSSPAPSGREQFDFLFEQHPFEEGDAPGHEDASQTARKLYVFDMIRGFEQRKVDAVLVPDFISHAFLDELAAEVQVPIISIMDALKAHVQKRYPKVHRLGILTSSYVRKRRLWERCFEPEHFEVIYPLPAVQENCLMPAIYGPQGIKSGHLQGESVNLLETACRDLIAHGAELVVSGFTEIPIVVDALRERGLPVIDSNRVYAAYAVSYESDLIRSSAVPRPGGTRTTSRSSWNKTLRYRTEPSI